MKLFHQMRKLLCNSISNDFPQEKRIELNTYVNIREHLIESIYSHDYILICYVNYVGMQLYILHYCILYFSDTYGVRLFKIHILMRSWFDII